MNYPPETVGDIQKSLGITLPGSIERIEKLPKATTEMMTLIYLDGIARALRDLRNDTRESLTVGPLRSFQLSVSEEPLRFSTVCSAMTVYNDGLENVYVLGSKMKPLGTAAPIKSGQDLTLDFKKLAPRTVYFVCDSKNTTTVNVYIL